MKKLFLFVALFMALATSASATVTSYKPKPGALCKWGYYPSHHLCKKTGDLPTTISVVQQGNSFVIQVSAK